MLKSLRFFALLAAFLVTALTVAPDPALAYVGPGAGLTAFGTVLALVAAVGLALVGFVWYPVRRLLRGRKARMETAPQGDSAAGRSEA